MPGSGKTGVGGKMSDGAATELVIERDLMVRACDGVGVGADSPNKIGSRRRPGPNCRLSGLLDNGPRPAPGLRRGRVFFDDG